MSKKRKSSLVSSKKFDLNLLAFQFFCFSIAGWLYEILLNVYYQNPFENRGFLYGPYLPVYGVGGVILLLVLSRLMKKKIKLGKINMTPAIIFVLIIVLTTALELITGLTMENLFGRRWWDYSHERFNYLGHISLTASLRFGILGIVFLYFITTPLENFFNKLSTKQQSWAVKIIILILIVDLLFSLIYRV